ncbi:ABC transporter permease [Notoacmeibacter sp. MSK16QG-6]|uniref:ABC transporter permease n=1 Tax=Notoacmeibacter sp. MSK16QG-6 TaxID=2957982 RepID=UPI00209E256A|nr:ABC transporter permease [Notoacmeibacter sp. MSK16QG-6]MCP1200246.1 ABC transporter permease [Notoacmeibacter sp. MSK16QG-6]
MFAYTIKRLLTLIPTLLAASVLVFLFVHLIPGDPASILLGDTATPEEVAALTKELGLDKPLIVQYFYWLIQVVQGDFGRSLFFGAPVLSVIANGAQTSILLALMTMVWIVIFGIPIGVLSASYQGRWVDQLTSGGAMLFASVPTFWLGLYLILIFAVWLGWLPSSGFPAIDGVGALGHLRYLLLPSLTLAAPNAALIIRLVRASMLDVSREDHVRTARAKGLHPSRVAIKHIFRNALIAVAAAFGFTFAALVSEAVVTETVFSLPGIGQLVVQSILRRDYPVIQGVILVIVVLYAVVNLLVDLAYARLDPRVSLQ